MTRTKATAILAAGMVAASLFGAPAAAQETALWGERGKWEIRVDTSVNYSCYTYTIYEDGSLLRIDTRRGRGVVYFTLANAYWTGVKVGRPYSAELQFDSVAPFPGNVWGIELAGLDALTAPLGNDVVVELMRRNTLTVRVRGHQVAKLSLAGSAAAMRAVGECNKEMTASLRPAPMASVQPDVHIIADAMLAERIKDNGNG